MGSYFFNLSFNNFELLAETARKWNLDCSQLHSGPVDIKASQIVSTKVSSGHLSSSCSFRLRGGPPRDMWTVMLSTQKRSARPWLLNKRPVPEDAITVYPPGYDFNNIFQPRYECYTFSMSDEYLGQLCEDIEIFKPDRFLKHNDIVECPAPTKKRLWRRAMQHKFWLDSLGKPEGIVEMAYWHEHERELLRDILFVLADQKISRINRNSSRASKILDTIDDYFMAQPYEDLTIQSLCRITGVKERTLQHNFKIQLGMTPKQYLQAIRLNRVRKELLNNHKPNGLNISQIAHKYGFWHMGQFASDYRRLFLELPSTTRKHSVAAGS